MPRQLVSILKANVSYGSIDICNATIPNIMRNMTSK